MTESAAPIPGIDIRPDHWQIVRHILRLHVPNFAVWAFGSRAKWTAKPHSDLDLVVMTEKPLPLSVSASLTDDFSESNLPWKVDVVDWATTSAAFREIIARDKVVLQEPGQLGSWRETTLGNICQQQGGSIQTGPFGSQLHASDYTQAGIPVVMPINIVDGRICEQGIARVSENMANNLARHQLKPGDIVFSRRGDVTRFALVSERETGWLCGTGCLKVSVGNPTMAVSPFIAAVLAAPESKEWLVRHAVGATMPNLNTEILGGVPVALPPLADQHAIAHLLGTLDDKIELGRRMNQTLESMAQALFQSWFVAFDGVSKKDRQQSELGLIPKGWLVEEIGKFVQCVGGATPSTKNESFWNYGEHSWATPKDLAKLQAPVLISTERCITDAGLARISSGLLPAGTLLLSSRAPVGYLAIVTMPIAINQGFIAMLPEGTLSPIWLLFWAKNNMEAIKQRANGSTFMEISKTAFRSIKVAVPAADKLAQFDEVAKPMLARIISNEREISTLATLRDTLLPQLMSGKLKPAAIETQEMP